MDLRFVWLALSIAKAAGICFFRSILRSTSPIATGIQVSLLGSFNGSMSLDPQ